MNGICAELMDMLLDAKEFVLQLSWCVVVGNWVGTCIEETNMENKKNDKNDCQ
jgi:hypothetical protein